MMRGLEANISLSLMVPNTGKKILGKQYLKNKNQAALIRKLTLSFWSQNFKRLRLLEGVFQLHTVHMTTQVEVMECLPISLYQILAHHKGKVQWE